MLARRSILAATAGMAGALLSRSRLVAQPAANEVLLWPNGAPGAEKMKLQQKSTGTTPGAGSVTGVMRPSLTVYRPDGPFTKAVLVVPGGGFRQVVLGKEGTDIARWLAQNGIATGVLTYRLPADQWPQKAEVMLQDAQRGLRLLRQQAGAAKVGILGFSAGGTIAEILDSRASEQSYAQVDDADALSAKPDFVGLGYAFLNVPKSSADNGFRDFPRTPAPTFIFHGAADTRVSVSNSLAAYQAIAKAGGKAELHVFAGAEHGFALISPAGSPSAAWPQLFLNWLKTL